MDPKIDEQMADQFQGNFIDASDITSTGNKTLTIVDVVAPNIEKDSGGKLINKPIISFKGAKKRLILNKINQKIIAMAYGTKPSLWADKKITLTVRILASAFGQANVPVVRIVPPDGIALTFGMRKHYGAEVTSRIRERETKE